MRVYRSIVWGTGGFGESAQVNSVGQQALVRVLSDGANLNNDGHIKTSQW